MSNDNIIFEKEGDILDKITELLSDETSTQEELRSGLEKITKSYKKFLRNQSKITKVNDSIHNKVRELSKKLEETNNQLETELNKAAGYVTSLLPQPIDNQKMEIKWKFVPSGKLGGDIFSYFMLDDENMALFLLDVSGHGVGAALHSVSALNVIRNQNMKGVDFTKPDEVFAGLNKNFQMSEYNGVYFTIWYGVLNLNTFKLKHSGSGHPPALLLREGRMEEILCPNLMIGAVPEFPFEFAEKQLQKGDELMIYSDGVYEIRLNDKDVWSFEEFVDYMMSISEDHDKFNQLYNEIFEMGMMDYIEDDFSIFSVKLK